MNESFIISISFYLPQVLIHDVVVHIHQVAMPFYDHVELECLRNNHGMSIVAALSLDRMMNSIVNSILDKPISKINK